MVVIVYVTKYWTAQLAYDVLCFFFFFEEKVFTRQGYAETNLD
jgi:hypothetical protein